MLSVTPNHDQATVNHEEIKGFMTAMTMPYKVHDPKQLDGIAPGDLINARLVVLPNDAYLTDVKKVGQAPLPAAPAETAAPSASSGFELLKPGEAVPDASFVDQSGKKRTFSSFKGSPVLMTFIYTKCPMPTFCPLMDQHFATIQKKLKDDPALKGRVHLVSVSFDPDRRYAAGAEGARADPGRGFEDLDLPDRRPRRHRSGSRPASASRSRDR